MPCSGMVLVWYPDRGFQLIPKYAALLDWHGACPGEQWRTHNELWWIWYCVGLRKRPVLEHLWSGKKSKFTAIRTKQESLTGSWTIIICGSPFGGGTIRYLGNSCRPRKTFRLRAMPSKQSISYLEFVRSGDRWKGNILVPIRRNLDLQLRCFLHAIDDRFWSGGLSTSQISMNEADSGRHTSSSNSIPEQCEQFWTSNCCIRLTEFET